MAAARALLTLQFVSLLQEPAWPLAEELARRTAANVEEPGATDWPIPGRQQSPARARNAGVAP